MHNYKANKDTVFNYNQDLSGNVLVYANGNEISIPGNDILEFVAAFVQDSKIAELERMDVSELLGLKSKKE